MAARIRHIRLDGTLVRKIILRSMVVVVCVMSGVPAGSGTSITQRAADNLIDLVEVSPSVVMLVNDHGANITCIALDSGLVFVDAGLSTSIAAQFRQEMEVRFDLTTLALALTHGHLDHIFGMGAFSDVQVIAAEAGRPLIERQLAIEWGEEAIEVYTGIFPTFGEDVGGARPFLPTTWVEDALNLGEGTKSTIFQVNGGHTSDSSNVYFPAEGVLVTGDLVQVDKYPYFGDSTNDLGQWIKTLKHWYALPVSNICPGHGHVVDRQYLLPIQQYFENLVSVLTGFKDQALSIEEVVVHPDLPQPYWPDQPEPRWWRMCIARAYSKIVV